jgi:ABC-type sugar transport system permease subunit
MKSVLETPVILETPTQQRSRVSPAEVREWLLFAAIVAPNLLLFIAFAYWPLIYNGYLSFVRWDMISPVKTWVGFENYIKLFQDRTFGLVLWNSIYFTGVTVVLTNVLGLAGALLLNQKLRGRNVVRTVMFAPTVLSGAALGIVWSYIFDPRFGLIEYFLDPLGIPSPNWLLDPDWAMPAVIIVYTWKNLGYAVVIFLAGLQAIPKELDEAATVDGADARARFWHVSLPGLSPIMFFLALTTTLASFQAFDMIKTMTNGGPVNATNTLIYYLYEQGFINFNAGNAGVAAVVLFGAMLAFTLVQMRYTENQVTYN